MLCREVMTRDPKCCTPNDTALRAARMMQVQDVGVIPVCSGPDSKRLVGIITDRDIVCRGIARNKNPLDLTAGDMGTRGSPEQRIEESEIAGRHMLLKWRGNLHMPDARLENSLEARMMLALKLREVKPRVVILRCHAGQRHPPWSRA